MDYLLDAVLVFFLDSVGSYVQPVVPQQLRHYLFLYRIVVRLGAETVEQLYLKLNKLFHGLAVGKQRDHRLTNLREQPVAVSAQGQDPADKRTLPDVLVCGSPVDLDKQSELVDVKHIHGPEHNRRHHELLVVCVHRRRDKQLRHCRGRAVRPLLRRPKIIKDVVHQLLMVAVQLALEAALPRLRLQLEHCNVSHECLKMFSDRRHGPVAGTGTHPIIEY